MYFLKFIIPIAFTAIITSRNKRKAVVSCSYVSPTDISGFYPVKRKLITNNKSI
jgi:hypothetical protein